MPEAVGRLVTRMKVPFLTRLSVTICASKLGLVHILQKAVHFCDPRSNLQECLAAEVIFTGEHLEKLPILFCHIARPSASTQCGKFSVEAEVFRNLDRASVVPWTI